jgi:two-component system, OmpR family, catabolic regulation response regulator CreB
MLPERQEIAQIVVCEDDAATLELLCDHLAADRFGALPAPTASDALRICRYKQPDLLLLDLELPDASGLDVLRQIREADGADARFDPRLPVIVLTGSGADAERVRGLEFGADDYLVKGTLSLIARMGSEVLFSVSGRR